MKKYCWVLLVGSSLLGCETGDKYYFEHVVNVQEDAQDLEEDLMQSDHKLPAGALSLSNVPVEEFVGTWVHYSKQSEYRKNLDEIVALGYSTQYIYLSSFGNTIVKYDCEDHPDSKPAT